jgi:5-(carboxyamino)imidazole ribonucleotide mutase
VLAAKSQLPVLAVPMPSKHLQGLDSLLAMVQMPGGIPVATFAIGEAGAVNAALFAVAMLALSDPDLAGKLAEFRVDQSEKVLSKTLPDLP